MSDCLFCKIERNEIPSDRVYEDEDVIVIRDIAPKADTHLLVIPRKHIASLNELLPEDQALMGKIMLLLPQLAKEQGLHSGFRTIINTDKGGGQEVFHIHVHLLGGGHLPFA
ncbi:histidine triad nucleotide-binding protein [Aliikangiella coralliicola]|uniref:Histidine triad nucleotide-binding protein n=1 Tax=Aliikangiella coralliicola TaxID=2592383 RepID=A0A545UHN2_9GAMM|nr:histidine triad nucleotide-binding protein [Aliikangiella coralliicola]TQV88975.1 histidine triad nucleotide-binding protein [Aliikangiella coralliicola]